MKITVTKEIRIASRSVRKTVELDFGEGLSLLIKSELNRRYRLQKL